MSGSTTSGPPSTAADQVQETLHAYCRDIDAFDIDALLADVYVCDAIDDRSYGAPLKGQQRVLCGHDEIRAYFEHAFQSVEAIAHLLTNVDVRVDGEDSTASSRVLAFHWLRSTSDQGAARAADFVMMGTYTDDLILTPAGWRIRRRRVSMLGPAGLALGTFPGPLA